MTRKKLANYAALVTFGFIVTPSPANIETFKNYRNYYTYHPMSVMTLGVGFSPNNLNEPKLRAVEFVPVVAEEGALSTNFSTVLVRNSDQLREALHLDIAIEGSYLAFKGGAKFTYNQSSLFDSDSLSVVISASTEYGRLMMKDQKLSKEAQALIDAGKMSDFEAAYGSDLVLVERRGSAVYVILTITNVSANSKTIIATSMEASGGWGPLSASAKAEFQTELERASKSGKLNVQVVATGGEGFGGLSDLVKILTGSKEDALKNIQESLGNYLKQFNMKNSAPIGFHTASMRSFGWKPEHESLWTENQERFLTRIVDRYRATLFKIDRIKLLINHDDPRYISIKEDRIQGLKDSVPIYEKYLNVLASLHKDVKEGKFATNLVLPDDPYPGDDFVPPAVDAPSVNYRVVLDDVMQDIQRSLNLVPDIKDAKLRVDGEAQLAKELRVKSLKELIVIQGEFLDKVELQFNGSPRFTLDLKNRGDKINLSLGDLNLKKTVLAVDQEGKFNDPELRVHARFSIVVYNRTGRKTEYLLIQDLWDYFLFG